MIDDGLIEQLGRAVHENYLREQLSDGETMGSRPSMRSWAELNEDFREANRAQARAIAEKIAAVGAAVVPEAEAPDPFAFTEDEIEALSREEYDRWAAQRSAAGWVYGPERDDVSKTHPGLGGWDGLSEVERDKDRDAVRNIPAVLAQVGLAATRKT